MTNESCVHCRMILKEATTTPVLAKEVGFRTEGSMADGSIRTDLSLRRSNATLWQFRMNMIPVDAQRAYSDYSTKSFSKDFEKHQTEYNKWSVAWQGKSLGNARSENNWFPVFVEAVVSHHNYEVHLYNLKRLYWTKYFVPTSETPVERAHRTPMRDSTGARRLELRTTWLKKLELLLIDRRTKMQTISTADLRGQLERAPEEAYLAKLSEDLRKAKNYKPLIAVPAGKDLIPPARLYYRDMSDKARKLTLFGNINKPPKAENCAIKVLSRRAWHLIEASDGLVIKIFIEGGADAPRIRLRLTIGDPKFPDLCMDIIFLAWSHTGTDTPRAHVSLRQTEATRDSFTFSTRLTDLRWIQPPALEPSQLEHHEALFGRSDPVVISWAYVDPICLNFDCLPLQPHALAVQRFKLLQTGSRVEILTKGSKKLTKNESAIGHFPSLGSDNSLEQLYRKRSRGWTGLEGQAGYTKKYEVTHLPPLMSYHDARHYEVFQTGSIMRDVEFEITNRSAKSFNGKYQFNFEPLTSPHAAFDRSLVVRLDARSRAIETLVPPVSGTQVTMPVTLGQDPMATEFVGNVISTPPSDNEYEIAMILTMGRAV